MSLDSRRRGNDRVRGVQRGSPPQADAGSLRVSLNSFVPSPKIGDPSQEDRRSASGGVGDKGG